MTDMAKRMLRDRIMDRARGGNDYEDGRYMRDRAMDRMDRAGHDDYRRRESNGRYMRDRADERYDDRRDYGEHRRERYEDDERDYRDYRDYRAYSSSNDGRGHEPKLKLPREDMKRWGQMLQNADGTEGMHFDKRMLVERIKHMGGDMEGYTEDDLCMAANMLYSDYCEVLRPYISREPEKEADFYIKMAKAFLDDEDAPDGSAKLAMYYFCIADVEE